jgi:hypothetical protein
MLCAAFVKATVQHIVGCSEIRLMRSVESACAMSINIVGSFLNERTPAQRATGARSGGEEFKYSEVNWNGPADWLVIPYAILAFRFLD